MTVFIKFEGSAIKGQSKKKEHLDWIELSSFSWGASRGSNVRAGEGSASGTAQYTELNISCPSAGSSTLFLFFLTKGEHFDTVTLDVTKSIGSDAEAIWLQIILKQGMITNFSQSGGEHGSDDNLTISFGSYTMEIWEQDKTGKLASTGLKGYDLQAANML